jgi:hypothetical protein
MGGFVMGLLHSLVLKLYGQYIRISNKLKNNINRAEVLRCDAKTFLFVFASSCVEKGS